MEHQGTRIVDSQVFSFLSEIASVNRILLTFFLRMKSLINCDSSRNLAPPFFPTYDYGIPGYEFGSLARSVYYNAFAHLRAERGKTECGRD